MIYLDTNIVVRIITQDSPIQAARASEFLEDHVAVAYLPPLIAAEAVFVLLRNYKLSRKQVALVLSEFVECLETAPAERTRLLTALSYFGDRNVDFPDAWLAAETVALGHRVASFDHDLARLGADVIDPREYQARSTA